MRTSEFKRHLHDLRETLVELERFYETANDVDRIVGREGRGGKGQASDPTGAAVLDPVRMALRAATNDAASSLLRAERDLLARLRQTLRALDAAERALARRPSERLRGRFVTKAELEEAEAMKAKRDAS